MLLVCLCVSACSIRVAAPISLADFINDTLPLAPTTRLNIASQLQVQVQPFKSIAPAVSAAGGKPVKAQPPPPPKACGICARKFDFLHRQHVSDGVSVEE